MHIYVDMCQCASLPPSCFWAWKYATHGSRVPSWLRLIIFLPKTVFYILPLWMRKTRTFWSCGTIAGGSELAFLSTTNNISLVVNEALNSGCLLLKIKVEQFADNGTGGCCCEATTEWIISKCKCIFVFDKTECIRIVQVESSVADLHAFWEFLDCLCWLLLQCVQHWLNPLLPQCCWSSCFLTCLLVNGFFIATIVWICFHETHTSWQHADLEWLSVFPGEHECLYPPGTYLK